MLSNLFLNVCYHTLPPDLLPGGSLWSLPCPGLPACHPQSPGTLQHPPGLTITIAKDMIKIILVRIKDILVTIMIMIKDIIMIPITGWRG